MTVGTALMHGRSTHTRIRARNGRAARRRSVYPVLSRLCAVGLLALSAGCTGRGRTPPPPDPDPERARAALATLHVDNQSALQLDISYHIAGRSSARVVVGRVAAASRAEMAPVPAGEPLILVARTNAGSELTLPPRTFAIDSAWTWRIERNARFVPPQNGHRP